MQQNPNNNETEREVEVAVEYNQPTFFIGPGEDVSGTFYIDNLGSCPE